MLAWILQTTAYPRGSQMHQFPSRAGSAVYKSENIQVAVEQQLITDTIIAILLKVSFISAVLDLIPAQKHYSREYGMPYSFDQSKSVPCFCFLLFTWEKLFFKEQSPLSLLSLNA